MTKRRATSVGLRGVARRAAVLCALLTALPATAEISPRQCEGRLAQTWVAEQFADVPQVTGRFEGALQIDSPAWLRDVQVSGARYGISIRGRPPPHDPRVALTNVHVGDLISRRNYGAAIRTHRKAPLISLFLVDAVIAPNWPDWSSYGDTNFDGLLLDGALGLYAQNLTVQDWHADAAIDNKAQRSQLVRLTVLGPGHRPLRFWRPGPHYLVHARIETPGGGALLWVKSCKNMDLRVFSSSFNGQPRLAEQDIDCADGGVATVTYLDQDPRLTGEMHPMFQSCDPG